MQVFSAIAGQSIFDVCLNTYGSLDFLTKLMQDNNFTNVDSDIYNGQQFTWDDSLVVNQQQNIAFSQSNTFFATDINNNGSVFYIINNPSLPVIPPNSVNPPPSPIQQTYQVVYQTYFTSNADGLTSAVISDINGNPIVGYDIISVTDEIKPLKYNPSNPSENEYSWNRSTATLTLLKGITVDNGMTLFILYSKIVSI